MSDVGKAEDRLAIRELLEDYADGINQQDAERWGATWAENSEWNLPVVPGMEKVVGKANIVAAWKEAMQLFSFVHMIAVPGKLRFEGNTCYARTYTTEVAITQDGQEIRPVGQYDDILVKENGEWLFTKRSFQVLHGE